MTDLAAHRRFCHEVMQWPARGDGHACGTTLLTLEPAAAPGRPGSWQVPGWSYLTVQVRDCAAEHAAALRRGAVEGEPPRHMGDAAIISFLRDPDGNFIELSQKAAWAGSLPAARQPGTLQPAIPASGRDCVRTPTPSSR